MTDHSLQSFWQLLSERAEREGESPAILQGETQLSFDEWHRRASAFGDWFAALGAARNARVLLWMESSPDMAIAMLGLWKAGAIFALIDTKSKESHFHHAVRTIEPALVVCDRRESLPAADTGVPIAVFRDIDLANVSSTQAAVRLPTEPASIVFTSGSTGRPKGVTQSHGNLFRACRSVTGYLGLRDSDRILCSVPWSFDYGYGQLLSTLMRGAVQILPTALNPFAICDAIATHRPTVFAGIPSLFTYLLRGVSPFRETDLSSILTVTNTGGKIPGPVFAELLEIFHGRRIFLNYGLTETYRTSFLDPALAAVRPTSIGRPIPGADVVIVRDDGSLAEPNEIGQIVHRGDYVCLGYWNDPEATAKSVRPDPLAAAGCPNPPPALYTGDYGHLDEEGFLYFSCRQDSQLKSMGVRVSPPEVEELLFASRLVNEVAVLGRPHEMLGDEIWAVVVPARDGDVVRDLTSYAREKMSAYMMPRRFLVKKALPKTTTGKIDYPALRAEILAS